MPFDDSNKCPGCGAEWQIRTADGRTSYACGTFTRRPDDDPMMSVFYDFSDDCRARARQYENKK